MAVVRKRVSRRIRRSAIHLMKAIDRAVDQMILLLLKDIKLSNALRDDGDKGQSQKKSEVRVSQKNNNKK